MGDIMEDIKNPPGFLDRRDENRRKLHGREAPEQPEGKGKALVPMPPEKRPEDMPPGKLVKVAARSRRTPETYAQYNADLVKSLEERRRPVIGVPSTPASSLEVAARIPIEMSLTKLAEAIRKGAKNFDLNFARTLEIAVKNGVLLRAAKKQMPHGQWLPWLQENTGVAERTAQTWMKLAKAAADGKLDGKSAAEADLTIRKVTAAIAKPKKTATTKATGKVTKGKSGSQPAGAAAGLTLKQVQGGFSSLGDKDQAVFLHWLEEELGVRVTDNLDAPRPPFMTE